MNSPPPPPDLVQPLRPPALVVLPEGGGRRPRRLHVHLAGGDHRARLGGEGAPEQRADAGEVDWLLGLLDLLSLTFLRVWRL